MRRVGADTRGRAAAKFALWGLCALFVFVGSLVTAYRGFWGSDLRVEVPFAHTPGASARAPNPLVLADYRLAVWSVGRNARALLSNPARLFEAESCHPASASLALHHPLIAPAMLALPAWILSQDPVLTFNFALFASSLVAALAMFLLVADWTRVPAAGLVAAVLYAFHPGRLSVPHHFFNFDDAWLLLALFFARRLFESGRWRDAVGLGVAGGLQTATSFYPFLSAVAVFAPFGIWLLWRQRSGESRAAPLALAVAIAALACAFVLSPYLAHEGDVFTARGNAMYAPWSRFLPGGRLFPGLSCLALVVLGFALGRERALPGIRGDPRLPLAIGAVLVALLATGGNVAAYMAAFHGHGTVPPVPLPNLFRMLAGVLPGLDAVRLPSALAPGVVLVSCILAGAGAGALLRALPRAAAPWVAAALLGVVWVDVLRPGGLGLAPRVTFEGLALRPSPASLDFFEHLEAIGNEGPLLELPMDHEDLHYRYNLAPVAHLLTAYHGRRSSSCYSSFVPQQVQNLRRLRDLEDPDTLEKARALGFTTVIVHHERGGEA